MDLERRQPGWKLYLLLWIVMMIVHQDFWFWTEATLLFGFLPVGLAYQAGYSLLAAAVMAGLVRWAWPAWLERLEDVAAGEDRRP